MRKAEVADGCRKVRMGLANRQEAMSLGTGNSNHDVGKCRWHGGVVFQIKIVGPRNEKEDITVRCRDCLICVVQIMQICERYPEIVVLDNNLGIRLGGHVVISTERRVYKTLPSATKQWSGDLVFEQ